METDVHLDEDGNPKIVERRFVVEEPYAGYRVDHYLKRKIPRLSRTKLQEIIKTQLLRNGEGGVKPSTAVATGDDLVIRRPARPEPPCPRDFHVLYEDDVMMVIDKPAGLPMHVSAKFYFNTLTRVLSERYPGAGWQICHRLDRETSGCVVLARGKQAAGRLKKAFADKHVCKTYLAIVHGAPPWQRHTIDLPLGLTDDPDALISIRMVVRDDALPSTTEVRVVRRAKGVTLLACEPITGRQHQIRAHLAAAGFPIVGDKLYAHGDDVFAAACDGALTDELRARLVLPRQALHAASIRVPHPDTGEQIRVDSPLPDELEAFLQRSAAKP